jgi:hypothetical protein
MVTFIGYGLETIATPLALTGAYTGEPHSAGSSKPAACGPIPPSPA